MDFLSYNSEYKPTEFFEQYAQAFVPPWYSLKAAELGKSSGRDFKHAWGWAFDQLMNETATPFSVGVISSYCFDPRGDSLPGATSRISDVYKSSFLDAIDWFAAQGWLDRETSTEYALSVCPVDFSLWDISPVSPPDWWPKASAEGSETDFANLPEFAECESLLKVGTPGTVLLGAEGAVIPQSERKNISTSFRLIPFGYKIKNPKLPEAELVASFLRRTFWQKAPTSREPLSVFSHSFDGWVPFFDEAAIADGLLMVPLLSRMESNNINTWLSWRGVHRPFFPALALVNDGNPGCDATSWFYEVNGQVVCRMQDWKIGTLEVNNKNRYWLHGQFAIVDHSWLYRIIEEHQGRLGYVLSVCIKHRKNDYSDAEEITFHKLLNVSRVAL